jgi:hypothetical protein
MSSIPSSNTAAVTPDQATVLTASTDPENNPMAVDTFPLSPLVRITLLGLYGVLTLPLPFLAQFNQAAQAPLHQPQIPPIALWIGIALGAIALYAVLSERVMLDGTGIQVTYPIWVPRFFRKGWQLPWAEVKALKPRSTGQGGLVYYFVSQSGAAYLLPMRVAGFARLVRRIEAETGIETQDVRPLSQAWMYLILLCMTLLLGLIDGWVIWTATSMSLLPGS